MLGCYYCRASWRESWGLSCSSPAALAIVFLLLLATRGWEHVMIYKTTPSTLSKCTFEALCGVITLALKPKNSIYITTKPTMFFLFLMTVLHFRTQSLPCYQNPTQMSRSHLLRRNLLRHRTRNLDLLASSGFFQTSSP